MVKELAIFTQDPEMQDTISDGKSVKFTSARVMLPYISGKTAIIKIKAWQENAECICENYKTGDVIRFEGEIREEAYKYADRGMRSHYILITKIEKAV
jgi:single-stranded DNA-binding protein